MADHLALLLPGSGYGPDGPVLDVPRQALAQLGVEWIDVPYPGFRPGRGERVEGEFLDLVHAVVAGIVARHRPSRLTFVAKSIGCEVVATLPPHAVDGVASVDVVWLTPVFGLDHIGGGAVVKAWPSLVVSGGADPSYDPAATAAVVEATGGRSLVIDGADHSLVIGGDVRSTIEGWRRVADAVLDFAQ